LDERGRVIAQSISSEDESITLPMSYIYDNKSNILKAIDAENKTTNNTYNTHNEITSVLNANNNLTQLDYDSRGNLKIIIDAKSTSTTYKYDKRNLLVKEIKQMGEEISYLYDGNANLVNIIDSKGQIVLLTYDDDGRLESEEHFTNASNLAAYLSNEPDILPVNSVTYDYNKEGYLTGYTDGETSAIYTLDELYRLESATIDYGTFSKSYSYTYYKDGQIATFTNAEGVVTKYIYDKSNRLNLVSISDQGSIAITEYEGRLPKRIVYPGGVNVTNHYDGIGRLVQEEVKDPADNVIQYTTYTRDNVGNVKTREITYGVGAVNSFVYEYDNLHRLISAEQPAILGNYTYRYDAVGNRTSTEVADETWIYNANHELEKIEKGADGTRDVTYSYDANGSTVNKTMGSTEEVYVYDLENRLREVKRNNVTIAAYYYDPFGQRIWKEVNDVRTYFLYASEGLIAEYQADGSLSNSLQYLPDGPWSTAPLSQIFVSQASI